MRVLCVVVILAGILVPGCARPPAAPRTLAPVAGAPAPDAPDHPDTLALARRLIVDSRTDSLRALVDRLAARVRARGSVDSLALVRVMELWSEYRSQPHLSADSLALHWALAAVRVKERTLGPGHHELAHSLGTLGAAAEAAREQAVALEVRERAVRILETKQGRERVGLMTALDDLGRSVYWANEPARAESLMRAAVAEGRAAGLTGEPRYQSALNNLAVVLETRGKLAEALEFQTGLLDLRMRSFGPVHRRVQLTRINLGVLHHGLGRYEEAVEDFRAALALDSLLAGRGASRRAAILQNLAGTLDALGDFAAGRRLLEDANRAEGDTLWYLHVLLADSHRRTGDPERARLHYEKGLAGLRASRGLKTHQATALSGLAGIEEAAGRTDEAMAYYRQSLALRLEVHGPGHGSTALALLSLARCEIARGRLGEAAAHADSADRALQRAGLGRHPDRVEALVTRARILQLRDRSADAAAALDSADALIRDGLGPDHPRRVAVLGAIARLAAARGEADRALEAADRAAALQRRAARIAMASLTEAEALGYAASEPRALDRLLALAGGSGGRDPSATERAYDATIRSRALVLDAAIDRRRGVGQGAGTDSARRALADARRRLARLWVAGLRDRSATTHRALLDGAWADLERAEKALASPVPGEPRDAVEPPGLSEVRSALPGRSSLISFVRVRPAADPHATGSDESPAGPESYLAFVQRADAARATLVPLGRAAAIDSAIERWRLVAEAGAAGTADAERRYRRVALDLRRRVWDPIAPHVRDAARLYVVPDGQLQLVDLAALPTDDGGYLAESAPPIALLTAELDLLAGAPAESDGPFVAVGDPAFGDRSGAASRALGSAPVRRGPDSCDDFARRAFDRLPASALEIGDVLAEWRARRPGRAATELRGHDATEARLRRAVAGASELHIATHGFFLPQRCGVEAGLSRGAGVVASGDAPATALLRAGLALAGANRRLSVAEGEDDGILTAEEVAALDLRSARAVVLSACETARGEAISGEGVFGLRRALHLAGARAMVMSLWPLEDTRARAWMAGFYRARWSQGRDVPDAVWSASREMLSLLRRRGRSTHPSQWGGFIAVGRD